jgi:hypothetical protein
VNSSSLNNQQSSIVNRQSSIFSLRVGPIGDCEISVERIEPVAYLLRDVAVGRDLAIDPRRPGLQRRVQPVEPSSHAQQVVCPFVRAEGNAVQDDLALRALSVHTDELATGRFQQLAAVESSAELSASVELQDWIGAEVEAGRAIAAEPGNDRFGGIGKSDLHALDERGGFAEDVFPIVFDACHRQVA